MHYRAPIRLYLLLFAGLAVANISIYRNVATPPWVEIRSFQIGKGTALLLHSPHGKTLLIDTGGDAGILRALGTTLPMWQRRIDGVILTSADGKSTGGLRELADRYHIPEPIRFGTSRMREPLPYGTPIAFDTNTRITVIAPHTYSVSYGATTLAFSSSTPERIFYMR